MEINGDVTDAGRTDDKRTREDRATQPMEAGWLSFATLMYLIFVFKLRVNHRYSTSIFDDSTIYIHVNNVVSDLCDIPI